MSPQAPKPQIIDYEGSQYRTDFWEGQGREYEDLAERSAIRRLLPSSGDILIEIGAGFGRLASLYAGYRQVVLMDYSHSLLCEARQTWGHDPRFRFVAASVYDMPFVDDLFSATVMVRVMHHLQEPALALGELVRTMRGGATFVMEYANKRNLKSVVRYTLRRQRWSPFALDPYEFVSLNYDFHPTWMEAQFAGAGLRIDRKLAISSFRLGGIKRLVSPRLLARADTALAGPAAAYPLSPSIVLRATPAKSATAAAGFFRCPACHACEFDSAGPEMTCRGCGHVWPCTDGIYDFRLDVSRETQAGNPAGQPVAPPAAH